MTNEEADATAANELLEYSKTQKRIACLHARIQPFAKNFTDLGSQLSNKPESIDSHTTAKGFSFLWKEEQIRPFPDSGRVTVAEFDPAELVQHLQDLQREMKQLNQLKKSLERMGHGHMLKD